MLVDGKWVENWQPVQAKDEKGGFVRQISGFRNWVTPDGSAGPSGIVPVGPDLPGLDPVAARLAGA